VILIRVSEKLTAFIVRVIAYYPEEGGSKFLGLHSAASQKTAAVVVHLICLLLRVISNKEMLYGRRFPVLL
jgi:hypothetical protein